MYIQQAEFYDGRYDLHPSAEVFNYLEDELTDLHATEIDLDWATKRIKQGFLDWVSSAIVIKKVLRFRLWKEQYSSWKEYCTKAIGKKAEMIKVMLDRADVVIELAKAGFEILPTNQSQVNQLLRCAKKLGGTIYDAWERVLESLSPSLITANAIAESLGFPPEIVNQRMDRELAERLEEEADERKLTVNEMLRVDYGLVKDDGELASTEVNEPEPEAEEVWQADLAELVVEHEGEIWLLATLTKLANFVTRSTTQFSWLYDYQRVSSD